MSTDQQAAIRMLANDLHRLNQAVMKAVEAGVSVELVRSARHHGGDGNWGDLLIPVIVTQQRGLTPGWARWPCESSSSLGALPRMQRRGRRHAARYKPVPTYVSGRSDIALASVHDWRHQVRSP